MKTIKQLRGRAPEKLIRNLERTKFTVGTIRSYSKPHRVRPAASGGAGGVYKGGERRLTRRKKVMRKTKRLYRRRKT